MKKILIMLLLYIPLFATPISLEKAMDLAIEQGEEVKIFQREFQISDKNLSSAFKRALPALFYTGAYLREDTPFINTVPIKTSKSGYAGFIGIAQPIFQGGHIVAGIKKSEADKKYAALKFLEIKRDIRLEVIYIYVGILEAMNQLEAYRTSKLQLEETLRYVTEKVRIGKAKKSDLLKAEYQLLDVEAAMIQSENQIDTGLLSLKQKLNLDPQMDISIENFMIDSNLMDYISYDSDLQMALENSISANLAKVRIEESKVAKMNASSSLYPHVNGFIGKGHGQEGSHSKDAWGGGITVNWNIFQFGKDYDQVQAANLGIEKARSSQKLTQDDIRLSIRSAYLDIIKFTKIERVRLKAFEEAQENFLRDQEKFRRGMISAIDFLISQAVLTDAKIKHINAKLVLFTSFEKYRSLLI